MNSQILSEWRQDKHHGIKKPKYYTQNSKHSLRTLDFLETQPLLVDLIYQIYLIDYAHFSIPPQRFAKKVVRHILLNIFDVQK